MMLGIGIDTGGTCTDAVVYDLDTKEILGAGKALTTKSHLETGIANALDCLPPELIKKAEFLALSTTLATNACVENKGSRAKLLMIGFDPKMMEHLKDIYASYGFRDLTQFIILDAKVENLFPDAFDPDWGDLKKKAPEYFSDCDCVGIVQKHPRANGGRFELRARQILKDTLSIPVTIAYDISNEIDILKTCAGTMLNARLIPLISEFMDAVHHVMEDRHLHIPLSIVRSDGTLMSEEMAKTYPVETLLCGPAASVVGGSELSLEASGIIVDMGGTTTDIALIHDKEPVLATDGIHIGQWKTMVNGLYVDTFGLGGDTAVRYENNHIFLDTVRVIPISVLASQYDHVLPALQKLSALRRFHTRWIHEFYVLQKDISGKNGYTEEEQRLCAVLKEKPLITLDLSERMGMDPHFLPVERLEQDGVLMKSGLTPTDMMILKGDFQKYNPAAANAALHCLFANVKEPLEQIPDLVYELVIQRMYRNLGRIILQQQYPKQKAFFQHDYLNPMLDCFYEQAKNALDHPGDTCRDAALSLSTPLPLIGVGAPVHIFLPRVAALLQTRAVVPEYAGVANALGAVTSRKVTRCDLTVKAEYDGGACKGYSLFENGEKYLFDEPGDAISFGKEVLLRAVKKRATLQGLGEHPHVEIRTEENRIGHSKEGLLLEIFLHATAIEP